MASDDNNFITSSSWRLRLGLSCSYVDQPQVQLNDSSVQQNTQLELLSGVQLIG